MGATFYKLVTGETPADATEIADDEDALKPIPATVSSSVRNTIRKAMAVRRKDRQQNIEEFLSDLGTTSNNNQPSPQYDSEETILSIDTEINEKYRSVDLGLSVKWAECNIGAKDMYEGGWLVGWGDETGKKCSTDLQDYPMLQPPKHIASSKHDIASIMYGEGWRMPTKEEFEELITKCKWVWGNGMANNGYTIIGPSGKSIFLPAIGYRAGIEVKHSKEGGGYWTDTLANYASAYALVFSATEYSVDYRVRYYGRCVRPVKTI